MITPAPVRCSFSLLCGCKTAATGIRPLSSKTVEHPKKSSLIPHAQQKAVCALCSAFNAHVLTVRPSVTSAEPTKGRGEEAGDAGAAVILREGDYAEAVPDEVEVLLHELLVVARQQARCTGGAVAAAIRVGNVPVAHLRVYITLMNPNAVRCVYL